MKKITALFCLQLFGMVLFAQNPIVPPGMYIADPEAHVWKDGKLYLYGSRDESDDYWCSYSHHVLSTSDLTHWDIEENAFSSKGENDQVLYSDKLLFAPDCAFANGIYYLYFCSPDKFYTEGVATSSSPYGPFKNGTHIKGAYQIDPAVLIDSDGRGYFYWGQGVPKVAKLKPNLLEIDTNTTIEPLDKQGNIAFHEGSSVRKIGDTYYLVFADDSRNNRPTCLGYAMGKSPMGPFTYKGILIDNAGCDPAVWNNHGSIEEFNGKWYVFYHRSTHASQKMRKACIEPIVIKPDGSIDEVEMTSQGAGPALVATNRIEAEWACMLSGNVRIEALKTKDLPNDGLAKIMNNDFAVFKYIDFGKGTNQFTVKSSGRALGGLIEIYKDSIGGKKIGMCKINPEPTDNPFMVTTCPLDMVTGTHAIYLKFNGPSGELFTIDWFEFTKTLIP